MPDVQYAQNAGINIAYQVCGNGDRDLVFVCGTMSHLEWLWADREAAAMFEALGRSFRLILFDKPGTGLSDPIPAAPTIDQRTDDVVAVMDAAGSDRAVVVGFSEGGFPAMMLAATRPERVEALVLAETGASMEWADDMEIPRQQYEHFWAVLDEACAHWGGGRFAAHLCPSRIEHPFYGPLLGAFERACMSPGMARSVLQGYHGLDLRDVARKVTAPTLVTHSHNRFITREMGLDLARLIPGARFVPLEGEDHILWTHNAERFVAAVEEFVTGRRSTVADTDRVLTTVVFTDIVGSTERIAAVGDAAWRAVLADHDQRMDELLAHFGGIPVKHTGDGRLAHFPRPARAVRFAMAMAEAARDCGLEIRAGVHTGECEAVGQDLIGLAVHVGARIAALAPSGAVLVSSTVKDLVIGSGLAFRPHGEHELRGAPGRWALHVCEGDRPGPLVDAGYDTDVRHEIAGTGASATP